MKKQHNKFKTVAFSESSKQRSTKTILRKILISSVTCFGGGVFLAACLLDLLPDVIHHINTTLKNEFKYDNPKEYPIAEILITSGFFIVLFIEQITLSIRSPTASLTPIFRETSSPNVSEMAHVERDGEKNEQVLLMLSNNSSSTIEHQMSLMNPKCDTTRNANDLLITRNLLMILSLVIHSVFEGIAIGSLTDSQTIIQLSLAILIHKSIISFSVGLKLIPTSKNQSAYLACVIFAAATPTGILTMLSMQGILPNHRSTKLVNDCLRAFACGTFFYITFFDVLPHELNSTSIPAGPSPISKLQRLIKTCFIFIGFAVTAALIFATK
ncbi:unnamed protein product [Adineta ricciae]|uniref:Uncharacterized protein n=1 Tax=Adineta ricciae TaxID=249248 RepID=A0A816DV31_ADIRI|nr:unnamed protein product [Adineta ricciae]CAF1638604.1 unnamed protein product [Adineta ricciae]